MENNDELIALAKSGDEKAMQAVFDKYRHIVSSTARRYFLLGGDKEDLTQDGMLGLFYAINTYNADKNCTFKTYAYRCVESKIISAIRYDNSGKMQFLTGAMHICDDEICGENDMEKDLIISETFKEIMDSIYRVASDFEKKVIDLYLQGYDYRNISEILDKPIKSIDNALHRIKKKVREVKSK